MRTAHTLGRETARPPAELSGALKKLRALLESAAIEDARALIGELAAEWPEDARVQHYARVLAPPVVSAQPRSRHRSLRLERAWLREHAHEHPGCWLAVLGDTLIAAEPDVGSVLDAIRHHASGSDALLHYEPAGVE